MNSLISQSKKCHCRKCDWEGNQDQLDKDFVETCFGNDEIETCPNCGSYEVFIIIPKSLDV